MHFTLPTCSNKLQKNAMFVLLDNPWMSKKVTFEEQ